MKIADLAGLLALPELADHLARVEVLLNEWITIDNDWLAGPSARVVRGGGKRLRPAITIAAAAAGGAEISEDVLRGAAAVELVHVGSLVHDDIIDEASTRRGVPTVNSHEGTSHAILVGDFLLSNAGRLASTVSSDVSHTLATAIVELCNGQSLETVCTYEATRTRAAYERSIEGKTAALLRASCRIGGLAGGLEPGAITALADFGTAFGMAFQIIDDVLDIASTPDALGKPVGNDIREGVYTLPLLLLIENETDAGLRSSLTREIDQATVERIVKAMEAAGTIEQALRAASDYNQTAAASLAVLGANPVSVGLAQLPDAYLEWALRDKTGGRYQLSGLTPGGAGRG